MAVSYQPAGDVSHKLGGRLPLLSAWPAITLATLRGLLPISLFSLVNRGTVGVNSLRKTVTRQHRGCDLNPGHSAPESSKLTTRLPSQPAVSKCFSMAPHIRSHRAPCSHFPNKVSLQLWSEQSVGDVRIAQLDWKRVPQARFHGCKSSVAITAECSRHHTSQNVS